MNGRLSRRLVTGIINAYYVALVSLKVWSTLAPTSEAVAKEKKYGLDIQPRMANAIRFVLLLCSASTMVRLCNKFDIVAQLYD
ncbi:uncharacterized protein L203_102902 [Cryptococcus depauperatus CBS 7841]|uniref:Uncharacterized protein n=1 Tax=Cryptococcus depauperatus CBS 7841 TaxID=1295531 RepID=A0AAJ8JSP5_9TREE